MDGILNSSALGLLGIVFLLILILLVLLFRKRIKQAELLSSSDPITGGMNDIGLQHTAEKYLSAQPVQYAVVMMKIENFSQIRQTFGLDDCNRVLIHLHRILSTHLGGTEPFGRINRGTFCFLLKNRQENAVRARLSRIYQATNNFNLSRRIPYQLNLFFGVYMPQDTTEAFVSMQEKASESLADCECESRYHFYKNDTTGLSGHKWDLVEQMDLSLQNNDLVVYFQPKIRLRDNCIIGAEALARWRHPQRGMLTPEMFVPLLEEYHMTPRLDLYLFEKVCQAIDQWKRSGWEPCPISVNLSYENLETENFIEPYAKLCQTYDVDSALIELELNAKFLHEPPEKLHSVIDSIHTSGFQCSLDNFGKGTIPLHLLRELDIDALKLDQSLFCSENNSVRNRFIIESVLKLATQLHIRTVAEGIDNASQVQYLQQAACDIIQGFYYFQPMPLDDFQAIVYQDGTLRYIEENSSRSVQAASVHRTSNSNIVMFSWLIKEDRIVFSDVFSPLLDGQLSFSNPMSMFRYSELIHENDRKDFFHLLERCRKEEGWVENALRFYTSEGHYEWLEVHLHKEYDNTAGDFVISGTLVNLAGWKNEVDRWKEKANRDALTGLYNREYFEQSASNCLEKDTPASAAIIFIDVDDFKKVNDALGHVIGDDVLCWVAKRVLGIFRHTDIVARYGGDEFVVFVNGIAQADLEKRLTQLCEVFRFPYRNGTIEYQVSGSIGAAMFPQNGSTYLELLGHADSATYVAKKRGKNQFVFYQPGFDETIS